MKSGESALIARRKFLRRAGMALMGGGIGATANGALKPVRSARADDAPADDVMKAGSLPERTLGSSTAPVAITEYASMTCAHCAIFANVTFPELRADYIDTGKVRYVFREFPLDGLAMAASMVARSTSDDKFFTAIEVLFAHQREWVADRVQPLMTLAEKQFGFSAERFAEIMADQQLFEKLKETRERGESFGVGSTPSFFVNGKKWKGGFSKEAFEKLIATYFKT